MQLVEYHGVGSAPPYKYTRKRFVRLMRAVCKSTVKNRRPESYSGEHSEGWIKQVRKHNALDCNKTRKWGLKRWMRFAGARFSKLQTRRL